jgi:hypothetical protein
MAITHVRSASNFNTTSGTSLQQAFAAAQAVGNLLVAWAAWSNNSSTCTVTDSQGNTWTPLAPSLATGTAIRSQVFWAAASAATIDTVTMTLNAAALERDLVISEFSSSVGWPTTRSDAANAATGTAANPSTTVTASAISDLLYGGVIETAGTVAAGTGFTLAAGPNGNGAEYKIGATVGSNTVPISNASSGNYALAVASFLEAVAATRLAASRRVSRRTGRPTGAIFS